MILLKRNIFFFLLTIFLSVGFNSAGAQDMPKDGYTVLSTPIPPSQKGKIDVVEIFWYGCSHCMALDPYVQGLEKELPNDVVVSRAHISYNPAQETQLKLYSTLKTMGLTQQLHGKVFEYIQTKRKPLATDKHVTNFLADNNVDADAYKAASQSLVTLGNVAQAKKIVQAAGVDFVPAFVIGGKYVTAPSYHKDFNTFQKTLMMLIEKSRAEQKGSAMTQK